ncbi:hypothetical protein MMT35_25690, partial [Escherichia coli]|nr:hypothetical protein [Escherichia coli]
LTFQNHTNCPLTDLGGKTCIFSHPVYLFLREFSLQDFRGGSVLNETWPLEPLLYAGLRLCLTFLSMAARLMQQKETASDCPRRAVRKYMARRRR